MPVACATAAWGAAPPASTATNTATSRRILISLPPSGERESGTQPHGHRSPPARQRGPSTAWTGREEQLKSEADAARQDERLAATDLPASFRERREVRTLELECGAAEQVQSRLGGGGADAPCGRRRVRDVQAAATVWSEGAACRDAKPVRDVAVDLPVMRTHARRCAGEEVIERDDAIERHLGKQRLEPEHAPAADSEIGVATPVELRRKLWGLRAGGGPRRRAPLGHELCRDERHGSKEQGTADPLPHMGTSPGGKSARARRVNQTPHIAKSDARICQDALTRSATIRTASPTTWRKPPATWKRVDALPCRSCNTPVPSSVRNGA